MQVKKKQLEPDMEPRTGSKLGKEYVKAAYYLPAYLTYMQSISCKMPDWMMQKLQSPSEVIFEAQENKVSHCFHCFPIYSS